MAQPLAIVQHRPIILDAEDIHLTGTARTKAAVRKLLKFLAFLAAPFFIAQAFAFGSFIYEEALQATSFGVRAALQCEDQVLAYDAVLQFESLMRRAQAYQDNWGCMAWWSNGAFHEYFYRAAPTQLAGMYAEGKMRGLWGENADRYGEFVDATGQPQWVDTWKLSPIDRLRARGFDPELINNPDHCFTCRERAKEERKDPRQTRRALQPCTDDAPLQLHP